MQILVDIYVYEGCASRVSLVSPIIGKSMKMEITAKWKMLCHLIVLNKSTCFFHICDPNDLPN